MEIFLDSQEEIHLLPITKLFTLKMTSTIYLTFCLADNLTVNHKLLQELIEPEARGTKKINVRSTRINRKRISPPRKRFTPRNKTKHATEGSHKKKVIRIKSK